MILRIMPGGLAVIRTRAGQGIPVLIFAALNVTINVTIIVTVRLFSSRRSVAWAPSQGCMRIQMLPDTREDDAFSFQVGV